MGEWYRVIKTIHGNQYVYMQRTRRVPGRKSPETESYSLGRLDGAGRKRMRVAETAHGAAMAIFGVEDEYGQRVDSLWNRYVNKEQKAEPQKVDREHAEEGKPADDATGEGEQGGFLG